jgi:conjugal transfer ATP-binding protein TraC
MQELVASTLGQGGKVFVLDVGRSFYKLCKLLGGEFLEFTPHSNIVINPFVNINAADENTASDSLSMIKPVLQLMAAPTKGTDDLDNALLEQALTHSWKIKGTASTIDDICEYLNNHEQERAKTLANMLFPYTSKGVYGRFFNAKNNVDLKSDFVVIELEELKEKKDLQQVILQMVIVQIANQMFLGDRQTPFAIIIDEAWDMLRGDRNGLFIETLARRLRKYNGALVVGTQSINDFYQSPAAQAAFDNSDWVCFLSQKKETIQQLKKQDRIPVDGNLEFLLESLHTKQGEYAEILIHGPQGYVVSRLILDPFSKVLYSTKADEYSRVEQLAKSGMSLEQAIEEVANDIYN